jgi:hypothetical protein
METKLKRQTAIMSHHIDEKCLFSQKKQNVKQINPVTEAKMTQRQEQYIQKYFNQLAASSLVRC